jgi:hypothetical protein
MMSEPNISAKLVTNAQATFLTPFRMPRMAAWNGTILTDITATIYGVVSSPSLPLNDELWMEAQYLGSSTSSLASFKSTSKSHPLAIGAAVAADTSDWTNTATERVNSTSYVVGDAIKVASNTGRVFVCIQAGNSAASEPVAVAASTNTLNPSDKAASITLSNGNLKGTSTSASNGIVRSVAGQASGKFYFEITLGSNINLLVGIGTAAIPLNSGNSTGAFCVVPINGRIDLNNVTQSPSFGALSVGQVVCAAIDLVNQRGWFRINGGNWNANASCDPTSNVGGIDISSVFANTAAFGLLELSINTTNATVNFGATAFAQSVPSGFSAGPAQLGYVTAVDGDAILDGTAVFRAVCRFKLVATFTSPQPQQQGYIYADVRAAKPSTTFYIEPRVYISGVSTDNNIPVSHKITTNAQATLLTSYRMSPMAIWNETTGADVIVTVYGVAANLPKNDEIWMELQYLGSASSPLATFKSTGKSHPLAVATDVLSDSSTWPNALWPATWDPATATAVTLSNNGLTVVNTGTTAPEQGARVAPVFGKDTGKHYFEVIRQTVLGSANMTVGVGTIASTYAGMGGGVGVVGAALRTAGQIHVNGVNVGSMTTLSISSSIGIAVDLDNRRIWFRHDPASSWNASGTADPANNIGGFALPAGTMVPFVTFGGSGGTAGERWDANFGSALVGAVPVGFAPGWFVPSGVPFKLVATLTSPQPQMAGYIYVNVRAAKPSTTYYIDPKITLS